MKLRYWLVAVVPGWLAYWGLSHLVPPIWAVIAAVWVTTVVAFAGIVVTETRGAPEEARRRPGGSRPADEVEQAE